MVNNVIGVVNYVIAARPPLLNFMIADSQQASYLDQGWQLARLLSWRVLPVRSTPDTHRD
jgi:hypothetical protein